MRLKFNITARTFYFYKLNCLDIPGDWWISFSRRWIPSQSGLDGDIRRAGEKL